MVEKERKEAISGGVYFKLNTPIWPEFNRARVMVECLASESRRKPEERSAMFPAVRLGRMIRGLSGFSAKQNILVRLPIEGRKDAYWVLHKGDGFGAYAENATKGPSRR